MELKSFDWINLAASLLLLGLSGFFAASEIGLLSVNRFRVHQLAEDGSLRARMLERLLHHPTRPLTAILVLITAINYTNESLVTNWLHIRHGLPEWVPFLALLLLVLLFAEVTPINYAAANPEIVATRTARVIDLLTRLCYPLLLFFAALANFFVRLLGVIPQARPLVTGEEVRTIVDMETERGVLEEEEKELIHSIFEFSDTIVREIMVPRIDMIAVSEQAAMGTVIETTIAHRFSRLPVYRENIDHIVGLVHVKNLLPYEYRGETHLPVQVAMRPATFVPETKGVSELLQEFRATKQALAIVLDEYGGTAGLVTVEDLLEEIVGEIYDEYDIEQQSVERIDARTLIVDGKLPLDELSDLLEYPLPEGEYDTVGGLLYSRFGDVPAPAEHIDIDGFDFSVERLDGPRITKVRVVSPESRSGRREGNA